MIIAISTKHFSILICLLCVCCLLLSSDAEISYRQQLEKKLKEMSDKSVFREKLSQQEMQNYKSQLDSLQEAYDQLSMRLYS